MNNYNQELLNRFKFHLFHSAQGNKVSAALKGAYLSLYRDLLLSTEMPNKELYWLAKKVKPIVCLRYVSLHEHVLSVGNSVCDDDKFVFADSYPLFESYFYGFDIERAFHVNEKPFFVMPSQMKVIAEFTCYHQTHDRTGAMAFLRPSAAEVLQQMPADATQKGVCAFEITFPSLDPKEIYDAMLDRHVSTVKLYALENGLPDVIKNQPVYLYKDDVGYRSQYE